MRFEGFLFICCTRTQHRYIDTYILYRYIHIIYMHITCIYTSPYIHRYIDACMHAYIRYIQFRTQHIWFWSCGTSFCTWIGAKWRPAVNVNGNSECILMFPFCMTGIRFPKVYTLSWWQSALFSWMFVWSCRFQSWFNHRVQATSLSSGRYQFFLHHVLLGFFCGVWI